MNRLTFQNKESEVLKIVIEKNWNQFRLAFIQGKEDIVRLRKQLKTLVINVIVINKNA